MKNEIVADGYLRFLLGKKAKASESIQAKHDAELASASAEEKSKIRERMAREIQQRKKMLNHKPSARTLW